MLSKNEMDSNTVQFYNLLRSTKREGIEDLIKYYVIIYFRKEVNKLKWTNIQSLSTNYHYQVVIELKYKIQRHMNMLKILKCTM